MAIPIDQYLHQEVKDYIRDKYGSKKKVISYFRKGSWQTSRYIQVSTYLKDSDIHYDKFRECPVSWIALPFICVLLF